MNRNFKISCLIVSLVTVVSPICQGATESADKTLLGLGAGSSITTGTSNTFIGYIAGQNVTDGSNSTYVGHSAGASNTTGSINVFLGSLSGFSNTTGDNNTFLGTYSGYFNTAGSENVFVGRNSGDHNTVGNHNTFLGTHAGSANTTGSSNTFVGRKAGEYSTGSYNTFVGEGAGKSNTTGFYNTFVGRFTGDANTTGDTNSFFGGSAGFSNTTGSENVFIGVSAGLANDIGTGNTYIGAGAGSTNQTGNRNVFLGGGAGNTESGSDKLIIENAISISPLIYGEFDNEIVGINGDLGVGTQMPSVSLHVKRSDGTATVFVEETNASTSPRTLMNLQNNGRPEIVMGNTGTGGEWSFGAGTNFILKQGAVGSASSSKTKHLTLFADTGNLEISGSIITSGPSCTGGCDAVLSDSYELPSIEEHAVAMMALGYLPNVGPTVPHRPVDLSEQYGRLLNELEHAHRYIVQLEGRDREQNERIARLELMVEKLIINRP